MASRDEFERAIDAYGKACRIAGEVSWGAAPSTKPFRAALLAMWPEPLTCEEEESLGCPDCVPAYYCPTHSPAKERDDELDR